MVKAGCILLLFCFLLSCSPGPRIRPSNLINTGPQALNIQFPANYKTMIGKGRLYGLTRDAYASSVQELGGAPPKELLFYARILDAPDKTPYRAVGAMFDQIDTAQVRKAGFLPRMQENKPYLHRNAVDRTRGIALSEYILQVDNGYFYLFSYAPISHLLPNEEDVILAQDSLRSKFGSIVVANLRPANQGK
jgi:hypothetical protein